uniref:Uncharacterized protein n=1 Tax=Rhizophora mucronata TaxID=61149 RepID=A0A2P2QVK6_RHIMU
MGRILMEKQNVLFIIWTSMKLIHLSN